MNGQPVGRIRTQVILMAMLAALAVASAILFGGIEQLSAQSATVPVRIGTTLEPAQLTVAVGTTVRWDNADSARHRMRSTSGPAEFDGDIQPAASFSFTFRAAGTYQYRDDRAPKLSNYWGTVTVTAGTAPQASATGTVAPGSPATAEVTMAGRAFAPAALTVATGAVVTFRNNDGREHTATARDGSFDSGVIATGSTFVKTFATPGSYAYLCAIHPDMTGTVNVTGPGGAPPTTGPTTPTPTPTPTPARAASDVSIIDFGFAPADFHVAVGGTVTWVNNGVALHTVTARDGSFDSGYIGAGGTFSRAFATAGTYQYICSLHSNMAGSVVVGAVPGAPTPPVATPSPRANPPSDVRAIEFAFEPAELNVAVGTTVTWANVGVAPHTITARDASFDSGTLKAGATFSFRFDKPGTFPYLCAFHPDMTGRVVVPDATGAAPPPQAPPARPAVVPAAAPPGAPGTTDVEVVDFGFAPSSVQIPVGGSVRWINSGVAPHTVTATDGAYDSGYLNRGEQFTRTYPTEGTFNYLCALHPGMTGAVVVGKASAPSAAARTTGSTAPSNGGSPGAITSATPASGRVEAEMRDIVFEPSHLVIKSGSTVAWTNTGGAPHTVNARDGSYSSGIKNHNEVFEHRFDAPGTFEYFCAVHPTMIGTVEVVAAEGAAALGSSVPTTEVGSGGTPGVAMVLSFLAALVLGAAGMYVLMKRQAGSRGGTL